MSTPEQHQPPLADLLKQMQHDLASLVHQEVTLARTELREIAAGLARNTALLGLAAVAAVGAALLLLAAASCAMWAGLLVLGAPEMVAVWLAPMLVGLAVAAVAAAVAHRALTALRQRPLTPRETIASITETRQWIRERAS